VSDPIKKEEIARTCTTYVGRVLLVGGGPEGKKQLGKLKSNWENKEANY